MASPQTSDKIVWQQFVKDGWQHYVAKPDDRFQRVPPQAVSLNVPVSLAGAIPEDATYANGDEFRAILEQALSEGIETLTSAQQKQVKMAREQWPEVDKQFRVREDARLAEKMINEGRDALTEEQRRRVMHLRNIVPEVEQAFSQVRAPNQHVTSIKEVMQETLIEYAKDSDKPWTQQAYGAVKAFLQGLEKTEAGLTAQEIGRAPGEVMKDYLGLTKMPSEHLEDAFESVGLQPYKKGDQVPVQVNGYAIKDEDGNYKMRDITDTERTARNFAIGLVRLAPELLVGFAENPYEFIKGLATLPAHEAELLVQAGNWTDIETKAGAVAFHEPYTEEEVQSAREELMQNPLGVVLAGLLTLGVAGRVGKGFKPKYETVPTKRIEEAAKEVEGLQEQIERPGKEPVKIEEKKPGEVTEAADAVQKREAEKVPVEEQAKGGEEVGKAPEKVPKEEVAKQPWEMTQREYLDTAPAHEKPAVYRMIAEGEGADAAIVARALHDKGIPTFEMHRTGDVLDVRVIASPKAREHFLSRDIKVKEYEYNIEGSPTQYSITGPIEQLSKAIRELEPQGDYARAQAIEAPTTDLQAGFVERMDMVEIPLRHFEEGYKKVHEAHMQEAIESGKSVPAEALKDYPDLAKKEVAPPEGMEAPLPPSIPTMEGFEAARLNSGIAHHKTAIQRNREYLEAHKDAPDHQTRVDFIKELEVELAEKEARLEKMHEPPESAGPPETLKLSKEEHSSLLHELDLEGLPEVQRKAHVKQFEKAKERGYDQEAFDIADRVIDKGEPLTAAQRAGIFLKTGELKKEYGDLTKTIRDLEAKGDRAGAEFELLRRDEVRERIVRLSEAFDKSGTEAGRAGALAQVTLNLETWDVESVHVRAKESAGRLLTRAEEQALEAGVERITEAKELVETLRTELGPEVEAAQRKINEKFYTDPKVQKRARKRTESLIKGLEKRFEILEGLEKSADAVLGKKGQGYPKDISPKDIKALEKHLSDLKFNAYTSVPTSTALEGVFKRIGLLNDHLANLRILAKKGEPLPLIELSKARTQLRTLIKDLEPTTEIRERQGQLESGNVEIVERPPTANLPPKLETAEIDFLDAKEQVRQGILKLSPTTTRGVVREYSNILRTLKATADVSYVGRQGALPSAALLMRGRRGAGSVPEAFMKSLAAAFKESTADKVDFRLRSEPLHYLREEAGLELTKIKDIDIYKREEAFWSNAAERIPAYGHVVKWSNRNMVTGLNVIRARLFDSFVDMHPNATKAELRAWADIVNVTSGRGNLGKLKAVASELSFGIFAPRFSSSRMETPFLIFKHWKEPRIRKEIARDMVRSTTLAGSVLAVASLAGYKVGTNFREADFGKIRSGDTRIDIFAGYQQWMRFLFRLFNASVLEPAGVPTGETIYPFADDPLELVWNYGKYKLAPSITLPYTLATGHNVVYEEQGRLEALGRSLLPMVVEDIGEAALEEKGDVALAAVAPLGVGVATHEDSQTKVRREVEKLIKQGKGDQAAALLLDWNRKHPDKPIKSITDSKARKAVREAKEEIWEQYK